MKNISFIIVFAVCVSCFSCTKQLNQLPVSNLTTTNFYTNKSDFAQAVAGAYSKLKAYPDESLWMGEMRSDNINASSDGNRDWQGINDFSPNLTTTGFITSAWNDNFNGIYNVNIVIDALTSKGGNIGDEALRAQYLAECRFLRAFYYFNLVRFYGEVPIIDKVMTTQEILNIGRSSVKDLYTFIEADLQFAIDNLPGSYTATGDIGRATSYAAKGMLGLVYMTASGPTYDIDGPGQNTNEYSKALILFNDIINSGKYVFGADYSSIFSYSNENNKEVIFDVQYMPTTSAADFPSMLVPSAYWTGIGLSGYGNGYGTTGYNVSANLMATYKNGAGGVVDKRDTFNIQRGFALDPSTPNVLDTTRPFIKKYINVALRGTSYQDWPINFIVLRYTDVLMMKAECILHGAAGTQSDVDGIVNQVRARAGVAAVSNVDIKMLMEERRREFLGEGLRWNDLVREGMAVTTMNNWIASDAITNIAQVVPDYVIYPVPQAEILVKKGLYTQNQGYH